MRNNVFSKPVIGGTCNINKILSEKVANAQKIVFNDTVEELLQKEREVIMNESYEKGRLDSKVEFDKEIEVQKSDAYERGYQSGKEEVMQEMEAKYLAMKNIFDDWIEKRETFLEELEADAIILALGIEKKVVGYEIQKNSEPLKYIISEALKIVKNRRNLHLHVSPEDMESFKQGAIDFTKTFGCPVEVVSNPTISKGGCSIETGYGEIDATVETRWQTIKDTFFSGIEQEDNDIFDDMFRESAKSAVGTISRESNKDSGVVS